MPQMVVSVPKLNGRIFSHLMVILVAVVVTHYAPRFYHPIKHTGVMTMLLEDAGQHKQYWREPNGKVHEMEWDGTMPAFHIMLDEKHQPILPQVTDIEYTDVNRDVRHFVSATLPPGK